MKRFITLLCAVVLLLAVGCGPALAERKVNLSKAKLLAYGFSSFESDEILKKWEKGEPLTPFHTVEYDTYNMPAEKNGLEGDTVLLYGTLGSYRKENTGGNGNYAISYYLEQEDGNRWLIFCAAKESGTLIGQDHRGNGRTVFDDLEGKQVEIYGQYMGYSEKYKVPAVNVATYGGIYVVDENTLVMTRTAEYRMGRNKIPSLAILIGAAYTRVSIERNFH